MISPGQRTMAERPRKKRTRPPFQEVVPPPLPLKRAPRTDLTATLAKLDETVFAAVEEVALGLLGQLEGLSSLKQIRLLTTKAHLLRAMRGTHRSIRKLVTMEDEELSLDALSLLRGQLERCFLALLLADNPNRWHVRYRKNAWKAFAAKYFRDKKALGEFEPYAQYFGIDGAGVKMLREFAHEMDVSEDEFQTLRSHVTCEPLDPRWKNWIIADMPAVGKIVQELDEPNRKQLAALLHPYYDNLSHFTHGGMVGVMAGAILRGEVAHTTDKKQFWYSSIIETVLPQSYVAMLLVATLMSEDCGPQTQQIKAKLAEIWQPFHSDGSPLGIAAWDLYARDFLTGNQA